jgi:adenosylmethionine-8-amino-7-oxononanoate aminotransferase
MKKKQTLIFPFERPINKKGPRPIFTKAKGYRLWNVEGKEYIDGISGTWHINLGYNDPTLLSALKINSEKLNMGTLLTFYSEEAEELAENLTDFLNLKGYSVFLTNSGSEAVEAARWMAKKVLECRGASHLPMVSLPGSFHGHTSGNRELAKTNFNDMGLLYTHSSEKLMNEPAPGALIYEPVQTGVRLLPENVITLIQDFQKKGTIIISDEVGCGLGRSGTLVASRMHNIIPDILVLSKGLTGGLLPLAATLISPTIRDALSSEIIEYAHTNAGSQLCCRVAIAALNNMRTEEVRESMKLGETLLRKLVSNVADKIGGTARYSGLLAAIEIPNTKPLNFDERQKMYANFLSHGVILRVSPADGMSIPFVPGFTYSHKDYELLQATSQEALQKAM